jgi:hypothetical protein
MDFYQQQSTKFKQAEGCCVLHTTTAQTSFVLWIFGLVFTFNDTVYGWFVDLTWFRFFLFW